MARPASAIIGWLALTLGTTAAAQMRAIDSTFFPPETPAKPVVETLFGVTLTDRYRWQRVTPGDDDYLPPATRLLHVVSERMRWKHALDEARRRAQLQDSNLSAVGSAA